MDHKHIILVCALGWLCTASARPFMAPYKQDAENQLYYPYFGLKQGELISVATQRRFLHFKLLSFYR